MSKATAKARFLILSDTHDEYDNLQDLPKADVVLHCGDLTQIGGLSNYKRAIDTLKKADAELKIVIAGNHDISLDRNWWQENLEEDDDPEEHQKAMDLFRTPEALKAGIHYLEEGAYSFTLKSGAAFVLYASPYTPEFNGFAFPYAHDTGRFSRDDTGIPDSVDIVMTHGPPFLEDPNYTLDIGHESNHCGCPHLLRAIARSKPLLHCFGHIHEGRGIQKATWTEGVEQPTVADVLTTGNVVDFSGSCSVQKTKETIMVNAAIATHGEDVPNHEPWILDLELAVDWNLRKIAFAME